MRYSRETEDACFEFGGSKRETRVPPNKYPIYGMIKGNLHLLFIPKRHHRVQWYGWPTLGQTDLRTNGPSD
jgi:hypothetical protein